MEIKDSLIRHSLVAWGLKTETASAQVSFDGQYLLIDYPQSALEESYLATVTYRNFSQDDVSQESPQIKVSNSRVKKLIEDTQKRSAQDPAKKIEPALVYMVEHKDELKTYIDVVFLPLRTHESHAERGGVFAISARGDYYYRRDKFEEAKNIIGVNAFRIWCDV